MNIESQKFNVIITKEGSPDTEIPELLDNLEKVHLGNETVSIQIDKRGTAHKFWIFPNDSVPYLCKLGREKYAICGELIMSKVLDAISLPHVKYLPATFEFPKGIYFATLSPDMIQGRTETKPFGDKEEMSARSLASLYINKARDNCYGQQVNYEHTVDGYCEMINKFEKLTRKEQQDIRTHLLKIGLLQATMLINDTHEENISFFRDKNGKLSVAPLFDYGSALQLDWNFKTTYNKSINSSNDLDRNIGQIAANKKNSPKFGVKTGFIEASTEVKSSNEEREKKAQNDSGIGENLKTLMKELAPEIVNNEELQKFYESIKAVNFEQIQEYYNRLKDPDGAPFIPDAYFDMCQLTLDTTTHMLDKEIDHIKNNEKPTQLQNKNATYENVR